MQQPIAVVWHKATDLRTHDHEPLARAHSSNLAVLHVFVVDPYWWAPTAPGGRRRTGALRTRFLRECLEGLRESLAAQHGEVLAVRGDTTECFAALCRRHRVGCWRQGFVDGADAFVAKHHPGMRAVHEVEVVAPQAQEGRRAGAKGGAAGAAVGTAAVLSAL